jgi:anti-sigma factor RsiW
MTRNGRPDMNEWEEQINALLDGELDESGSEALKRAAEGDPALARAIIEAYELQRLVDTLPRERAPATLRRRLRRIPREQRAADRPLFLQPRWAMAMAAVPLALALVVMYPGERRPSEAELAQARQDLAVALTYLRRAGEATGREIRNTLDEGASEPVAESTVRTLAEPFKLEKERDT